MLNRIEIDSELFKRHVERLIELSALQDEFFAGKMDISFAEFLIKKQKAIWSTQEIERLLKIADNQRTRDYLDEVVMIEKRKGNFVSSEEFERQMGWEQLEF
jgi:hypothetical protein